MMAHFRNHPNVVGLVDFVCLPEQCVLIAITERLDYDLDSVLKSSFVFEQQQTTCLMYQLLFALLYIHRAGVVHGNITPANIQLSASCDLKLGGFGCAHGNGLGENPSEYAGSRLWKAPEQAMCEESLSSAVDVWAVGCILAQVYNRSTAGLSPEYKPLFSGKTHTDHLGQIVDLLGTPSDNEIRSADAKEYIQRNLSGRPRKDLASVLHSPDGTAIPEKVVELLSSVLQFRPEGRATVEEVMQHPFFAEHHHPEDLQIPKDRFRELDDLERAAEAKVAAECGAASPLGGAEHFVETSKKLTILHFITAFTDELRRGLEYSPPEAAPSASPGTASSPSSHPSAQGTEEGPCESQDSQPAHCRSGPAPAAESEAEEDDTASLCSSLAEVGPLLPVEPECHSRSESTGLASATYDVIRPVPLKRRRASQRGGFRRGARRVSAHRTTPH
jgi:serine/threonine protein kinase